MLVRRRQPTPREALINQTWQLRGTRLARRCPSLIPPGAILLQVAASPRESDALALAGVLPQKGFSVLIVEPTADNFYRVEVGPYADGQSVQQAKLALNREGFQVIARLLLVLKGSIACSMPFSLALVFELAKPRPLNSVTFLGTG